MISVHAAVAERNVTLDLEQEEGRTLAIIGRNGTGKSTLISLIAGLLAPDPGGSITMSGVEVAGSTWVPPHRRPIALLSQDPTLFPHLSVLDNVTFGLIARRWKAETAKEKGMEVLEQVGCAQFASRQPSQLSGGQAQRVALARALAVEPEYLLLDEPLAAMDIEAAARLRNLLAEVLATRTGIIVTHDLADVFALADDVAVLAGGKIAEHGPVGQLREREDSLLRTHFLGF